MQPQHVAGFIAEIQKALASNWSDEHLKALSDRTVPEEVSGQHGWLLRGDLSTVWGRWFIESLVDLAPFQLDSNLNIAHVHAQVLAHFNQASPHSPKDERDKYARILTDFAWQLVQARRDRKRLTITAAMRDELWAQAQPDPRCYLCGHEFGPAARGKFLGESGDLPVVPSLVDFTRPRTRPAHACIEVDHVTPVAQGGKTETFNLRLACGWCNSVKNRYTNIYDAIPWASGIVTLPELGAVTQPQALWVLRTVATRRRCEFPGGCPARIEDSELFAAPRNSKGAMTPVNVGVYCQQHDPWAVARWIGPQRLADALVK
ncbi:hypothetical protein GCM10010430_55520 [Kitasatospora cystarginea]|uniref:HNH domain-containing protein n=1 Tax=Kitasatospora cystarginea TaxID=58350 RepID=A0ABN3ENH5_9ACTN